jgi:hypothetical protein
MLYDAPFPSSKRRCEGFTCQCAGIISSEHVYFTTMLPVCLTLLNKMVRCLLNEQDSQCTYNVNTEGCSRNHCCCGNATYITQSCVCVCSLKRPLNSVSQPPGRGPEPGPGINYTGPREASENYNMLQDFINTVELI